MRTVREVVQRNELSFRDAVERLAGSGRLSGGAEGQGVVGARLPPAQLLEDQSRLPTILLHRSVEVTSGQAEEQIDGRKKGRTDRWTGERTNIQMEGQTTGRKSEKTDLLVDENTRGSVYL